MSILNRPICTAWVGSSLRSCYKRPKLDRLKGDRERVVILGFGWDFQHITYSTITKQGLLCQENYLQPNIKLW